MLCRNEGFFKCFVHTVCRFYITLRTTETVKKKKSSFILVAPKRHIYVHTEDITDETKQKCTHITVTIFVTIYEYNTDNL